MSNQYNVLISPELDSDDISNRLTRALTAAGVNFENLNIVSTSSMSEPPEPPEPPHDPVGMEEYNVRIADYGNEGMVSSEYEARQAAQYNHRNNESEAARQQRLETERIRFQQNSNNMSDNDRERALDAQRDRMNQHRDNETDNETDTRLSIERTRSQTRRDNMNDDQEQQRRDDIRDRMRESRANQTQEERDGINAQRRQDRQDRQRSANVGFANNADCHPDNLPNEYKLGKQYFIFLII